jgi:hypothetical protein
MMLAEYVLTNWRGLSLTNNVGHNVHKSYALPMQLDSVRLTEVTSTKIKVEVKREALACVQEPKMITIQTKNVAQIDIT